MSAGLHIHFVVADPESRNHGKALNGMDAFSREFWGQKDKGVKVLDLFRADLTVSVNKDIFDIRIGLKRSEIEVRIGQTSVWSAEVTR